jgi:hypothetical protein
MTLFKLNKTDMKKYKTALKVTTTETINNTTE